MKKLIALALISAAISGIGEIAQGQTFEVEDKLADDLIAGNLAKLAADADATPTKPVKTVKVRLLTTCQHGIANDVVTLSQGDAKAAEASGEGDTSKEAVAYALTLPQNKPKSTD